MNQHGIKKTGFVAIIATIIISLVLVISVLGLSKNSFYARGGVLSRELKAMSYGYAEGCIAHALYTISENYYYLPKSGGDTVSVGSGVCKVVSINHEATSPQSIHKNVEIFTEANEKGAFTYLVAEIKVFNPLFRNPRPLEVLRVYEVPGFN